MSDQVGRVGRQLWTSAVGAPEFGIEFAVSMSYKGEGLDLVAPQGGTGGRAASARSGPSGAWLARALEPADGASSLWVDEPVLRCCNQAYDLAVAHRASEVGLEHLVHAMTLVVEAIEALRHYNVNVTTLRQESAAIIASDLPVSFANGQTNPSNSEEFTTVLRFAADRAYAHRSPITIEDILDTLFDMKSDLSSRNLLARHRADWRLRTNPDMQIEDPRERNREAPTVTDSFQNTRIDALERMVHELSEHIAENRSSVSELLDELRGAAGSRPPANGAGLQHVADPVVSADQKLVLDQLYSVERSVASKFDELARAWGVLGNRIDALENTVEALPVGGEPSVLEGLVATIDELNERAGNLTAVAGLGDKFDEVAALAKNLDSMAVFEQKIDRLEAALVGMPDRLMAMERRLAQSPELGPLTTELRQPKELISSGDGGGIEVAPLVNAIAGVERRVEDNGLMVEGFVDRFDRLDRAVVSHDVDKVQMQALIDTAMARVGDTFANQRDGIAEEVARSVADRVGALSNMVHDRQMEQTRLMTGLGDRIGQLEQRTSEGIERVIANGGGDNGTHDAMIKLNTNQQTLALAVDQLREETKAESLALRNEITGLLRVTPMPVVDPIDGRPDMNEIQRQIDDVQAKLTKRQDFWTRFRIWLYGTDDWYGASWGRSRREQDV
ncbi:MAG: hypothetical protein ACR2PA_08945 [Hyphomicrobiaceae bacterium]